MELLSIEQLCYGCEGIGMNNRRSLLYRLGLTKDSWHASRHLPASVAVSIAIGYPPVFYLVLCLFHPRATTLLVSAAVAVTCWGIIASAYVYCRRGLSRRSLSFYLLLSLVPVGAVMLVHHIELVKLYSLLDYYISGVLCFVFGMIMGRSVLRGLLSDSESSDE